MKIKKTKPLEIMMNFGERSEERKIDNLRHGFKKGNTLRNKIDYILRKHGIESIRNINLTIEGGYSETQVKRRSEKGLESDNKYYFGHVGKIDKLYNAKGIETEVLEAIENISNLVDDLGERYDIENPFRLSRIKLTINLM